MYNWLIYEHITEDKTAHGATGDWNDQDASNGKHGHVSVDIDMDDVCASSLEDSLVEAYMKFMYWTCVSPFHPTENNIGGENTYKWVLNVIQKVSENYLNM